MKILPERISELRERCKEGLTYAKYYEILPDALDDLEELVRENHRLWQNLVAPAIADRLQKLERALEEVQRALRELSGAVAWQQRLNELEHQLEEVRQCAKNLPTILGEKARDGC